MWGLFHDPPLPRGQEESAPHFILVTTSARGVAARNALCVKGQADTQDWKYQKPVLTDSRKGRGPGPQRAPRPARADAGAVGDGEGAKQLQAGTRSTEQISSTLRPVQDGEQEEPEVPAMGGGVQACERLAHPQHTGRYRRVSVPAHLHTRPSLLRPRRETSSMTPHPSPSARPRTQRNDHVITSTTPWGPRKTKAANSFVVCFKKEKPI